MNGIQKTSDEARSYVAEMEKLHGEKWAAFRLPAHSRARKFGDYACCKESERQDYEAGGAVFLDAREVV
jgi:hypothetical protein